MRSAALIYLLIASFGCDAQSAPGNAASPGSTGRFSKYDKLDRLQIDNNAPKSIPGYGIKDMRPEAATDSSSAKSSAPGASVPGYTIVCDQSCWQKRVTDLQALVDALNLKISILEEKLKSKGGAK